MKVAHLLLLASVVLSPMAVHAQWQWVDKDNKKVFSDKAPPPEIPEQNILRRPNAPAKRLSFSTAPTAPEAGAAAPASAPAAAKPSGVDKELAEKARKAEEAEKARQAAEAQKIAEAKADNCARARQAKSTYDSGVRVARVNAQGEREFIDDSTRAVEQQRLQSIIDSDCSK